MGEIGGAIATEVVVVDVDEGAEDNAGPPFADELEGHEKAVNRFLRRPAYVNVSDGFRAD